MSWNVIYIYLIIMYTTCIHLPYQSQFEIYIYIYICRFTLYILVHTYDGNSGSEWHVPCDSQGFLGSSFGVGAPAVPWRFVPPGSPADHLCGLVMASSLESQVNAKWWPGVVGGFKHLALSRGKWYGKWTSNDLDCGFEGLPWPFSQFSREHQPHQPGRKTGYAKVCA